MNTNKSNDTIIIKTNYGAIELKLIEVINGVNFTFTGRSIEPNFEIEGVTFKDFQYHFKMKNGLPIRFLYKVKTNQDSFDLNAEQEIESREHIDASIASAIANNYSIISSNLSQQK